jgi:hypothetical protein
MPTRTDNIEPLARAICEAQARALWDYNEERLAAHVERYWHCVAAELEAGLIDETGVLLSGVDHDAGLMAYRDWRARHPEYVVPKPKRD